MQRDILLQAGDYILAFGALPTLAFVLDYGLFRWIRRRKGGKRYVPWWRSGVGATIFLLAFGSFLIQAIVLASLFLGPDYPYREWFRIIGYTVSSVSHCVLFAVYAIEGRRADSVMVPAED